jgi:hypothetical protein
VLPLLLLVVQFCVQALFLKVNSLNTVLPVVKTFKSFIPYNAWNNTLNALTVVGITYMSSQTELDPSYYFSATAYLISPLMVSIEVIEWSFL